MKTASAVSLALFLGSMTLLAQSSGRNPTTPAVMHGTTPATNCPVGMQAQQQVGQGALDLAARQPKGIAQSLRLSLNNSTFQEIVSVRITVLGFNAKGRMAPAQMAEAKSSEITKSLDLKIKVGPKSHASLNILLPDFTSVRVVNLDSIRYADGSNWKPTAVSTCHAVPNDMLLISSR
ncbi:MAG: hypothetical protein WA708_00610 [Acidobacteriaceae bacterium]